MFFFFNDTATTEIYTLSLHDALPILDAGPGRRQRQTARQSDRRGPGAAGRAEEAGRSRGRDGSRAQGRPAAGERDRKSTRLNSSHANISYAVFCLKKKKNTKKAALL